MVKGQVSLEYLMTYGIAIAIVVIAVAALYSMGVFSPSSSTVACSPCFGDFAFNAYGGGTLELINGPRAIENVDATCSGGGCTDPSPNSVAANGKFTITGINQTPSTVEINISYNYVGSAVTMTDTATIHN